VRVQCPNHYTTEPPSIVLELVIWPTLIATSRSW